MSLRPRSLSSPFLSPDLYRLRRWHDAARALPFLGIFLFALPNITWLKQSDGVTSNIAIVGIYLSCVWALLIVLSAIVARILVAKEQIDDTAFVFPTREPHLDDTEGAPPASSDRP